MPKGIGHSGRQAGEERGAAEAPARTHGQQEVEELE